MGRRAGSEPRSTMSGQDSFRSDQQAIPVARDPIIGPVAGAPRQQQEYPRPGPAGQVGENPYRGIGFEIGASVDNGDVRLGVSDINAETPSQHGPARSLD